MAATNYDNSPVNTRVLFDLKDLGMDKKSITVDRVTMESEKYICIRETKRIVIIDMAKPAQPIKLPVTADSAIMNPDIPILAFKVEVEIDGTTQDQLQILDIKTKAILKSYNIAEKVECWKWVSPKLLGLVTLKTVYHWSIEGSTEPVKMLDIMTDKVASWKIAKIWNFMHDPSGKWLAVMGDWNERNTYYSSLFVRPYQGGDQLFSLTAQAAAFATFHVEGNDAPSTLLCSAVEGMRDNTYCVELNVSDELCSQQGEPNFEKKQSRFSIGISDKVTAVQISQKYGLIYVITLHGVISVHDIKTAKPICSYNITKYKTYEDCIICTTEVPNKESFYAINKRGQVLRTSFNSSTIQSSVSDEHLLTREQLHDLQELCRAMSIESEALNRQNAELQKSQQEMLVQIEGLKMQNAQLQSEKEMLKRETEEQLTTMRIKLNNFLNETLNEIDDLKKEKSKLQDERDKITKHMEESLQLEAKTRREIEEQLENKIIKLNDYQKSHEEMMNIIKDLKMQNIELTNARNKFTRNPQEFCCMIESNNLVENFSEFTEAELRKVTNDFNDSNKIEESEYGSVYKAFLGLKPVAMKILKHESHNGSSEFHQEISISRIRHPNLVMLLGACTEKQALIYELMPNGSLHDILRNKNQSVVLKWKTRIHIASHICSGLICLHSAKPHSIVHGNLKSTNILLDSNYTAKLSDFGTFGHLQQNDTDIVPHHLTMYSKALAYIDPEYFSTNELTTQSDVYSFGIVLLELVSGRDPMGLRKSMKDALRKGEHFVDATAGEWPSEEARRMVLLGLRCSDPSAENRPDLVSEVLVEIESMQLASLRF